MTIQTFPFSTAGMIGKILAAAKTSARSIML